MTSLVRKAPRFTVGEAARIAAELYEVTATAESLPSERDQNFLLEDPSCQRFVLKIANPEESFATLDLQNRMIRFLAERGIALEFPRVVQARTREDITTIRGERGRDHFVRLLTWVEGTCFARVEPHTHDLLRSLGRALGQMDAALTEFDHPAAHRPFYWDLRQAGMARPHIDLLPDSLRRIVDRFFVDWENIDWSSLRFSVIHNDANDYNVLVRPTPMPGGRVNAIVDYGDVVYTATICELAIALAYVMLGKQDPIVAAAQVLAAYHETYPLTEAEVGALYALISTRLCCSACYAACQTRNDPDNEYLRISNGPVAGLLEYLSSMPSNWALQMFRYACGWPASGQVFPYRGRAREDILALRKKHLAPSLSISYQSPLNIVCGSRQYLYDSDGRRYLDCVNNVAHVGHSDPRVVQAAAKQMAILNTNTRYLHENLVKYAERLTETFPEPLQVVYLVCSGSEANELALRLAGAHTHREEVIVVDAAYHGNTGRLIDISPYKFDGPGGRGCASHVHKVPMPDVYRGAHRGSDAGSRYADYVADATRQSHGLAAFFCESALGCGGQIILPRGYLHAAYAAVRAAGGVCVADEVQTGLGRAGSRFWMFETQEVVPDIVTIGKPIGNGHPLAAVVTTPEIAASFSNGMEYFNTFGGNPVSCAVGLAVLDVLRDEELQKNAMETGKYLKLGLQQLQEKHSLIGDVRGVGLFLGIELVRNRKTCEPADGEAAHLIERMKERCVLLSTDGPFHNVIKIKPPLVFSMADADCVLGQLDAVLCEDFQKWMR